MSEKRKGYPRTWRWWDEVDLSSPMTIGFIFNTIMLTLNCFGLLLVIYLMTR